MDDLLIYVKELWSEDIVKVSQTQEGNYLATINFNQVTETYNMYSKQFERALKNVFYRYYNQIITKSTFEAICEILEILAYGNVMDIKPAKRIFYNEEIGILYDLGNGKAVSICDGKASIVDVSNKSYFLKNVGAANQVLPDLTVGKEQLFDLVRQAFGINDPDQLKLMTVYLLSCFTGIEYMSHVVAVVVGPKGSGKSTFLRKLERVVDPKLNDISGMQYKLEDMQLKLNSDYMACFDNISSLSRKASDQLCMASTGSSVSRRVLYTTGAQMIFNIKSLVAINSVSLVAKESDLLDRCFLIPQKRYAPVDVKIESEIWSDFKELLPKLLGAIFNTLAEVIDNPADIPKDIQWIRMADYHRFALSCATALDVGLDEINKLLWDNQKLINQETINSEPVALCVIELMQKRKHYSGSMGDLLKLIVKTAEKLSISKNELPKSPNHLRIRLDKCKSNLEQNEGIFYNVHNNGSYKEINIERI